MFRILVPALIFSAFSQNVKAISDSNEILQDFLLEEFGTLTYQVAGNNKKSLLSVEAFQAMGLPEPVSLTELRNTIQDNELKAEERFPGPFATFGHIDRVTRVLGAPAVRLTLAGEDKWWRYGTVTAFFDETDAVDLANFEPGNWLTVVCDSWTYSTGVGLKGCELLPTFSENFLSQPDKTLKRACRQSPGRVASVLSLTKSMESQSSSDYADFRKKLWSHSYFRRTGMIADSTLKEMQREAFDAAIATEEVNAVKDKLKAGEFTIEECLAY